MQASSMRQAPGEIQDAREVSALATHAKVYKELIRGVPELQRLAENNSGITIDEISPPMQVTSPFLLPPVDLQRYLLELTENSDAVITGIVRRQKAELVEDRSFVFTDYVVTVEEVLKQNNNSPIPPVSEIIVTRPGGVIKNSKGKVVLSTTIAFLEPFRPGSGYLLFLRYLPRTGAYGTFISKGSYQLSNGTLRKLTSEHVPAEIEQPGNWPYIKDDILISLQRREASQEEPYVDYLAERPPREKTDSSMRIREGRYDKTGWVRSPVPGETDVLLYNHRNTNRDALPVRMSELVVIGKVAAAHVYLSNDKSGVYTEFSVTVQQVLKRSPQLSISAGGTLTVERPGGAVRFPSGQMVRYRIGEQGLPVIGESYLFFLKQDVESDDYHIETGYQLRNGRVTSLDSSQRFAYYTGFDSEVFVELVRASVNRSSKTPEKGRVWSK